MRKRTAETKLQRELRETEALGEWVRAQLYAVPAGGRRADATTAIAAAAAEEVYRLTDQMPEWQNDTGSSWREQLARVWAFVGGDRSQHYALSRALAVFLLSPFNHIEGQDGPDDFDRPQTVASYSATLAAVVWGVDFAVTAVMQIFEALDLKHADHESEQRWADVQREIQLVRRVVTVVVSALQQPGGAGLDAATLASLRS